MQLIRPAQGCLSRRVIVVIARRVIRIDKVWHRPAMVDDAHRGHGAAAIHVVADVTAIDVDFGVALHIARIGVVGVSPAIAVSIVLVGTATCAVDVAAIGKIGQRVGIGCRVRFILVIIRRRAADGAAKDVDLRFQVDVAVFTAAIHRAFNLGVAGNAGGRSSTWVNGASADVDGGIGHISQAVHESVGGVNLATARAVHHAVLVTMGADGAARNGNSGMTA